MTSTLLRVICGPTSGGKSALAMRLAEHSRIAVVSADSRQVYREFDVGTAKPTRDERARVPHYGIDIIDPSERYSAARWAEDAKEWIAEATSRDLIPVIVGGTGLYIRALFEPLSDVPELEASRRAALDEFLREQTTEELHRWCDVLDPTRAHLGKTQLVRAIETALLSGSRISDSYGSERTARGDAPAFTPDYLVVDPGPAIHRRIESRFDEMVERGWLGETRRLAETVPDDAPAWKASGYGAMRAVARGETDLATARARVIIETRQYAKRQRTWFRNQLENKPAAQVTRVDPESPGGDLIVQQWWDRGAAGE
ncbi:MAG: tRNA (adenosine(37)-N6)-dimethylallyltransferase MiaA [Gemmatimonadota bacterium]|nr:tRNA (adenosine(37)-N6)-dimethylallyltransferase MiaA [Gemmatimonadota bacterium]